MDDPTIPGDQAAAPDRVQLSAPPQDFTETPNQTDNGEDDEQTSEDVQASTSADTTSTSGATQTRNIRTTITSTRETSSTSMTSEEEPSSTSESTTLTSTRKYISSTTEESTSSVPTSSTETSELTSIETTTSSEERSVSRETSSSPEVTSKLRPPKTTQSSSSPLPTKALSKGSAKDDGLGTGTTIGIVLAAFVGAGVLLIVVGALLRWRRRRRIAKKSEGLPAFKTILDFADPGGSSNSIDLANEKAAKETSTVPVTSPYRPDIRQAQKRNSWYNEQQAPDNYGREDHAIQRANSQRPRAGPPANFADPGGYVNDVHRAQTMDDRFIDHTTATYGGQTDYGSARLPSQLRPGRYGDHHVGGAFDPVPGQQGYGNYQYQNERDAPPVRNRHFPTAPGRAYTADNPYPFVPTGHR